VRALAIEPRVIGREYVEEVAKAVPGSRRLVEQIVEVGVRTATHQLGDPVVHKHSLALQQLQAPMVVGEARQFGELDVVKGLAWQWTMTRLLGVRTFRQGS